MLSAMVLIDRLTIEFSIVPAPVDFWWTLDDNDLV